MTKTGDPPESQNTKGADTMPKVSLRPIDQFEDTLRRNYEFTVVTETEEPE